MRPFLLISLLLVSTLVHEAQAIRLKIASLSDADGHKFHHEGAMVRRQNADAKHFPDCQNELCSGRSRKLLTKTSASITTTSKNNKNEGNKADPKLEDEPSSETLGRKEVNFSVNSSPVTENGVATPQRSPDILDIAGMDYSPATRKPPIHN